MSERGNHCTNLFAQAKSILLTKNTLVFLVFLLLSLGCWVINALNKTYEERIRLKLEYKNLPKEIGISSELPDHIDVKVKDNGFTILNYKQRTFPTLILDLGRYSALSANQKMEISTSTTFDQTVLNLLAPSTVVTEYFPQEIRIERTLLQKKRVAVQVDGSFICARQHHLAGNIILRPDSVTLYGNQAGLDSIHCVRTKHLEAAGLNDTLLLTAHLVTPIHTKADPAEVQIEVPVEIYTEAHFRVPVRVKNCPSNLLVNTFPSEVELKCLVGISDYSELTSDDFQVYVDYNDLVRSNSKTCLVELGDKPSDAINVKLKPLEVQWTMVVRE